MCDIIFRTIPKATNEILFVMGLSGFIILYIKKKDSAFFYIGLCLIFGMIIWRSIYVIQSSRYAAILIYPFSISSAVFLAYLKRNKIQTIKFVFLFIVPWTLISWINKSYNVNQINSNLRIIAELHDKYNKTWRKWTLMTNEKDAGRIKRMEAGINQFQTYYSEQKIEDLCAFIDNYRSVDNNILYNITLNTKDSISINKESQLSKYKYILSIYSQRNKKKRENIYTIESKAGFKILSKTEAIKPESGILKNGDLELIDSPEESYNKFKKHIDHYTLFYDVDQTKRTPINAYFHNDSTSTQYLPYYSCLNKKAISGNNSARIITTKHNIGFLLFYQKFYSGLYQYSFVFTGKKGSTVCLLYDIFENKKWNVRPLATYSLSSEEIIQIDVSFVVPDLYPDAFFLVGAWVQGDVYLDNFHLEKRDD